MSFPTSDADIEHIARGLIDRTLPKREWTHAAHFAAALWLLRDRADAAFRDMPPLIRAYNESTGVANTDSTGYHETITLASLRLARAWLAERRVIPLHAALAELLTGPYGRSDWLLAYWSKERLFSVPARRAWLDPDLRPFTY
jgi:hypothetical protein